jgi:hypothetical protein
MEQSLQAKPSGFTPEQLNALGKELRIALAEFEPLAMEAASEKPDAVQVDSDKLASLLAEIKPLLEKGDFGASNFVEELQGIIGMDELAERIDDYDFEGALNVLNSLRRTE